MAYNPSIMKSSLWNYLPIILPKPKIRGRAWAKVVERVEKIRATTARSRAEADKKKESHKPRNPYFICNGPHWVSDYLEKNSLNALTAQLKGQSTSIRKEPQLSMDTLQCLIELES